MALERPAGARIASARITSVDALRGLTIAFMILVNDPGDWNHVYRELDHSPWSGWTLTDLVFPTFLFLAGCATVFSVQSRLVHGISRRAVALRIVRRSAMILLIQLLLTAFPYFHLTRLRLFGVLTRIALCYLLAGLLFLWIRRSRDLFLIAIILLAGYWVLLRFVPIPGLGYPVRDFPLLDPDRNLTAWMDRGFTQFTQIWLHTGRLYEKTRDPEGLLSTLPSIATTLFGILAGLWLRGNRSNAVRSNGLMIGGLASASLGELWSLTFPINKKLWTSSYVLLTAGLAAIALGLFFWALDVEQLQDRFRAVRWGLWPMLVFGSNAITAYAVSELLAKCLFWWKIGEENEITLWAWLYNHFFAPGGSTANTSLAFGIVFALLCFIPNWLLWRRKILLRA
jgi:predicted acyltransferase